ncbi:maltodextrin utilization protein YvdJ [Bacillus oleivorans]|uniref:Maltodextrin utilization protein YvdJ n=1 Tax=Bacillus oleivorans TaxID=1448271 RepID=A0A285CJY9_9BACI|nr:DUF1189 domain-containing protein [Bacillus oleivorans]SNX67907.1 maltodextrin utilization protein YvdJ [Bacillus oleivorans]
MNIFKQFYRSLFSPGDIASFRMQGIGKTILYVFFLALLSVIPTFYNLQEGITKSIDAVADTIEDDLPDFTIENGTLTSERNEPLILEKYGLTLIFDSSGNTDVNDLDTNEDAIALLKNEFVLVSNGVVDSYPYTLFDVAAISKQDVQALIQSFDSISVIFLPILFVIMYVFSAGIDFLEITILAAIGLILVSSLGKKLKYGQVWRMTAYCITLPTVFFMIMGFLKTTVPGALFIHWGVSIIFLYLAVKEIPESKATEL